MQTNARLSDIASNVRLADLLGSGSTASVFRAQRVTGGEIQMVAVKIPNADTSLVDEVAALRRFVHPNIVRLIGEQPASGHAGASTSVVLELCSEGTVEDLLLERPLTPGEVHMVVASIGSALDVMHATGWIHGDVNPSNIGLRATDLPCLIDFGACRPADGAQPALGTDGFTSRTLPSSPMLDVRGLIATALAALGPAGTSPLNRRLEELLLRCDSGDAVSTQTVVSVFDDVAPQHVQTSKRHRAAQHRSTGGPTGPRTRQFGPRPGGNPTPVSAPDPKHVPLPRVAAIAVLALVIAFIGIDVVGTPGTADALAQSAPASETTSGAAAEPSHLQAQLTAPHRMTALETLDAADARWIADGPVMVLEHGRLGQHFRAGHSGDLAAIGDWNCDGTATLGVFRPANGTWFVFGSWDTDAVSTVETIATANGILDGRLLVDVDSAGCARPAITATTTG